MTNKSYFSGSHLRGTCRPAWKIERETFEWELINRRPKRADWRWEHPLDRIVKAPNGYQQVLFEGLPIANKAKAAAKDPNQLELAL